MSDPDLNFHPQSPADWPRFMVQTFRYFGPRAPIPYLFVEGDPKCKLVVIVGENAAGKSLARRLIQAMARTRDEESIHLSMEGRTRMYMASMVYGSEEWCATGANSAHTILMGIKTSFDRKTPHVLFWDEPDVGLSDNAAAGAGVEIRKYVTKARDRKLIRAVFVTSHNRHLVRELAKLKPHYLHLGMSPKEAPDTLEQWCERPVVAKDLTELKEAANERFKRVQRVLDGRRRR